MSEAEKVGTIIRENTTRLGYLREDIHENTSRLSDIRENTSRLSKDIKIINTGITKIEKRLDDLDTKWTTLVSSSREPMEKKRIQIRGDNFKTVYSSLCEELRPGYTCSYDKSDLTTIDLNLNQDIRETEYENLAENVCDLGSDIIEPPPFVCKSKVITSIPKLPGRLSNIMKQQMYHE